MSIAVNFEGINALLMNSRFIGNPPELSYDASTNDFTLGFTGGSGAGGGFMVNHDDCKKKLKTVIAMHKKLNEFFRLGLTMDNMHALIEILMEGYEAY